MVFRISRGPYITSFHLLSLNLGRSNRSNWSVHYTLQHFLTSILLYFDHPWYTVPSLPASTNVGRGSYPNGQPAVQWKMAGKCLPSFLGWSISYKVSNKHATLRVEWLYMTLIIFHESSDFLKWNTGLGWLLQTKITVIGNKDQFPIVFWGCYTFSRTFGKHIGCLDHYLGHQPQRTPPTLSWCHCWILAQMRFYKILAPFGWFMHEIRLTPWNM